MATYACQEEKTEDAKPEDAKTGGEDEKEKKLKTVTIEVKPIKVFETFEGRFESTQMHEIKTDFDEWSELEIDEIVEEGTAVTGGQVLLRFDTEKIDKSLAEAEFDVRNTEFAFADAQLAMQEVSETFDLDMALAERAWKNSQVDYEYYKNVAAPERLKDLDYDERTAGYRLEYNKDELDQLEQMYTEDELTEESEEIVLKRARRSVESAERSLHRSMLRIKREREIEIERDDLKQTDEFKRASLELEKSKIALPIKKQRAEIALAKAEFELANKKKQFEKLSADRAKMDLSSDANGVVYYGHCQRGKWSGPSGSSTRRMEVGKKLPANKVVLTVVDVNQMFIRADLKESQLDALTPRMRGKAKIKSGANVVVPVMIKSISRIPLDADKFDCELIPEGLDKVQVMPGMTCKMSFLVYENNQAIVAPKDSVFSDDGGISHYVYVVKDDETNRKDVQTGRETDDLVEITDGLDSGDVIAKSKP